MKVRRRSPRIAAGSLLSRCSCSLMIRLGRWASAKYRGSELAPIDDLARLPCWFRNPDFVANRTDEAPNWDLSHISDLAFPLDLSEYDFLPRVSGRGAVNGSYPSAGWPPNDQLGAHTQMNRTVNVGVARHSPSVTATEAHGRKAVVNGPFSSIEEALEDMRQGRMVVVCDDEGRENEGDLTLAAQFATPDAINFMAKEGRGLVCLALSPERCDQLGLDLMAAKNESRFETAFTISIEAHEGVTTGISAADRARTIQVAIDPRSTSGDLVQPGHVFPLKARRVGSSRVDLQACKLEYSIVSPK